MFKKRYERLQKAGRKKPGDTNDYWK